MRLCLTAQEATDTVAPCVGDNMSDEDSSKRNAPAAYRVLVHRDDVYFSEAMAAVPSVSSKCAMQLRELATVGRTHARTKSTVGANRGWRRSPLGGNGGNHFYLYWTPSHPTLVPDAPAGTTTIFVRAVRHHDATSEPLGRDRLEDYEPLLFAPDFSVEALAAPFTDTQQAFALASDRVRAYIGAAGGGKTQALIRAIEIGAPGKTLYLTWSVRLAEQVMHHFNDPNGGTRFLPPESSVRAFDVRSWFAALLARDVPVLTLADLKRQFTKAVEELQLPPTKSRVWANREWDLFAEVRGHLAGGFNLEDRQGHFSTKQYVDARKEDGLSEEDANSAAAIWTALTKKKEDGVLGRCFPELEAARDLFELSANARQLPESMRNATRVVIDEVQDLTPLELAALMRVLSHIRDEQDRIPEIVIAGDEGQTVRPSAYKNARLKQTIKRYTTQDVATTHVEANLRCPAGVVAVLDRLRALYANLPRTARPGGVRPSNATVGTEADLVHVALKDQDEAVDLLEQLAASGECTCIFLADEVPLWAASTPSAPLFLTPESSKGHEYPVVLVFGVGRFIRQLRAGRLTEADLQWVRTQLDRATVALSRTTGTLILADIGGEDDEAIRNGRELLFGDARRASLSSVELLAHLGDGGRTALERAEQHLRDASNRLDEAPEAALQLIRLALFQLTRSEDVDSFTTADRASMQSEIDLRLLELLLHPTLTEATRVGVARLATGSFAQGPDQLREFVELLCKEPVERMPTESRLALLRALQWVADSSPGLVARRRLELRRHLLLQTLREAAEHPALAERLGADAGPLLALFEQSEWASADTLRAVAAQTLLQSGNAQAALTTLLTMEKADDALLGAAYESLSHWAEAAACYNSAGDVEAVHRCFRAAGDVASAIRTASDSATREKLEQLRDASDFLRAHFLSWMTPSERSGISDAIAGVDHAAERHRAREEASRLLREARQIASEARTSKNALEQQEVALRKQADALRLETDQLRDRDVALRREAAELAATRTQLDEESATVEEQTRANAREQVRLTEREQQLATRQQGTEKDEQELLAMLEEADAARRATAALQQQRDDAAAARDALWTRVQQADSLAARLSDELAEATMRFQTAETELGLAQRSIAALRTQSEEDQHRFLREREALGQQLDAANATAVAASKASSAELLSVRQALAKAEIWVEHWKSRAEQVRAGADAPAVPPRSSPAVPPIAPIAPPTAVQSRVTTPELFFRGLNDANDYFWRTQGPKVIQSLLSNLSAGSNQTLWSLSSNAAIKRTQFEPMIRAALGRIPTWEALLTDRDARALHDWLSVLQRVIPDASPTPGVNRSLTDTAGRAVTPPASLGTFAELLEQARRKG